MNYEHRNESANDIVGRIIEAKKIFSEKDCDTQDQLMYWNKVKLPMVYIRGILYDADDHPGAKALAAILRHAFKHKVDLLIGRFHTGINPDKEMDKK
ncbi:MAG: hypothetical protein KGO96_07670 [Elusimicrobia bacterium]|nr:hypothetical protein [Elusimicrobiota bacterium]